MLARQAGVVILRVLAFVIVRRLLGLVGLDSRRTWRLRSCGTSRWC